MREGQTSTQESFATKRIKMRNKVIQREKYLRNKNARKSTIMKSDIWYITVEIWCTLNHDSRINLYKQASNIIGSWGERGGERGERERERE